MMEKSEIEKRVSALTRDQTLPSGKRGEGLRRTLLTKFPRLLSSSELFLATKSFHANTESLVSGRFEMR